MALTKTERIQKLAEWYEKAEQATSRKEVKKIIKKAEKHARKLALADMMENETQENL